MLQRATNRSVLISSPPSLSIPDKRLVINDEFYQPKSSVFKRLGSSSANIQSQSSNSHKRSSVEPIKPAKRLSVDTSDGIILDARARNPSSIRITHAPLKDILRNTTSNAVEVLPHPRSLNEIANKLPPPQSTSWNTQGIKSMPRLRTYTIARFTIPETADRLPESRRPTHQLCYQACASQCRLNWFQCCRQIKTK